MKNKKGISAVVGSVLMVVLVMVLTAMIWVSVKNVVEEELEGVQSCLGNYDKITLNNRYTCYNSKNKQLNFSISVEDVNVSEIIVLISGEGETKSLRINGENNYLYTKNFADIDYGEKLILPSADTGKSYSVNTSHADFKMDKIDLIEIGIIIGKEKCDISDFISSVDDCRLLV
ncbi:hypothetical protein HN832_04530 [archaeon]|jgi:FlaG/FlaF family flagellin (archaellin)|nr:hypothetical protein [archaeon]MBT4373341.1 hypothetical protein [archaeon]MBT4531789.1 hypothetical protein [archaeon]MBT7001456.1 hypothetical protein [archaeon]MBT7282652.1 hypothetical protein [archaeon]